MYTEVSFTNEKYESCALCRICVPVDSVMEAKAWFVRHAWLVHQINMEPLIWDMISSQTDDVLENEIDARCNCCGATGPFWNDGGEWDYDEEGFIYLAGGNGWTFLPYSIEEFFNGLGRDAVEYALAQNKGLRTHLFKTGQSSAIAPILSLCCPHCNAQMDEDDEDEDDEDDGYCLDASDYDDDLSGASFDEWLDQHPEVYVPYDAGD